MGGNNCKDKKEEAEEHITYQIPLNEGTVIKSKEDNVQAKIVDINTNNTNNTNNKQYAFNCNRDFQTNFKHMSDNNQGYLEKLSEKPNSKF